MKNLIVYVLMIMVLIGFPSLLNAQDSRIEIRSIREASNEALKNMDDGSYLDFLMDDVQITTGAGTVLSGKQALIEYMANSVNEPIYWLRTAEKILVNEEAGLAWERGNWGGYHEDDSLSEFPVVKGKYAAQWKKVGDTWKIQSQIFVTLD